MKMGRQKVINVVVCSLYRSQDIESWTSSWMAGSFESIEVNSSRTNCKKRKMYKDCKYSYNNPSPHPNTPPTTSPCRGKGPRYNEMAAGPLQCDP